MPGKLNQRDLSLIITDNASVDSDAPSINDKFNESAMVMKRGSFGMILIDKSTKFLCMNAQFKEIFGYDIEDIPDGKTWFRTAFPDPEYRRKVISTWIEDLRHFLLSKKSGERRTYIFTVVCKNGAQKIINFIPVQLANGSTLMACEDITELVKLEDYSSIF